MNILNLVIWSKHQIWLFSTQICALVKKDDISVVSVLFDGKIKNMKYFAQTAFSTTYICKLGIKHVAHISKYLMVAVKTGRHLD